MDRPLRPAARRLQSALVGLLLAFSLCTGAALAAAVADVEVSVSSANRPAVGATVSLSCAGRSLTQPADGQYARTVFRGLPANTDCSLSVAWEGRQSRQIGLNSGSSTTSVRLKLQIFNDTMLVIRN